MQRLRRVDCNSAGLRRRKTGRGFTYLDPRGQRVADTEVLARIRALAIPPTWTDVWICTDPRGHIQAVGTDSRGRRQYRYHDVWRQRRDLAKFEHMVEFARSLPDLRATAARHLDSDGLSRERVLACAVRLLDVGSFRIGSECYTAENETFGLATIRRQHVRLCGGSVVFDYLAKGGKRRIHMGAAPME